MTARRFVFSNKKLRGISRRLRALNFWAESFSGYFPDELNEEEGYWNVKIPVLLTLVQGKQSTKKIQAICAKNLIIAAYNIFQAKPDAKTKIKVTCCIVLPDMFSSEICIFTSENYFNEHTQEGYGRFGKIEVIRSKSLAQNWELKLPEGFSELGILRTDEDDNGNPYVSEHWYFGEVNKNIES